MEKSVQENDSKIELLSMPNEILVHIFIHLEDKDLLSVSHVCKSFACAVEVAIERKYSNKIYEVDGFYAKILGLNKVMLSKYGDKLTKINISDVSDTVLELIEQKCCNLNAIKFYRVDRIISLSGLKEAILDFTWVESVKKITKESFAAFIKNNQQLEKLHVYQLYRSYDLMETLHNQLPMLTDLVWDEYRFYQNLPINIPKITLQLLDKLELLVHQSDLVPVLCAIDCDHLKELNLPYFNQFKNVMFTEILKFKMLSSLQVYYCSFTTKQLRKMADHLPDITELGLKITESESNTDTESKIFSVLSIFTKLTKLQVNLQDFERFLYEFKSQSINEFHGRFTMLYPNVELFILDDSRCEILSTSKDRIYLCDPNSLEMEMHWMDSFNNNKLRKTITKAFLTLTFDSFKIVNNCSSQLDISIFDFDVRTGTSLARIKCLEITSKGPITDNANVSVNSFHSKYKLYKLFFYRLLVDFTILRV